ncbi:MAG TPA: hypothetical protein VNC50_15330 [Planctomycetia bacterium]|nr:hypothetical protein [Planctomycetia bacterium]
MNRRLMLAGLTGAVAALGRTSRGVAEPPKEKLAGGDDRPLVALWRRHDGRRRDSQAPYLRFALWADGRVLYAADPSKWGHELRQGKASALRIARLKAALIDTGVFDLRGTCYLVPDAPCDCLMFDLGSPRQMLYWDEVETAGYGINSDPKPQHRDFKRSWKAVNHLVLVALPDEGAEVEDRIQIPASWYLKEAVQSE